MYENATVNIYAPVNTKNDEGTTVRTFSSTATATFRADVQSHVLSVGEMELWGLSNKTADVKKMFYKTNSAVTFGSRASVLSDWDGITKMYEIKPVNNWPNHSEVLLVPVQGE